MSQPIIIIRPIQERDQERVAAIIREVMTRFGCDGPGFAMLDPEVDTMYHSYQPEACDYFVLEVAGEVLGGAGIAPLEGGEPGICELRKMYFLPAVRGQGLGRRLAEMCLAAAREKGYHSCYLETLTKMKAARSLYEKLGFKRLDKALGETGHFGCDYSYLLRFEGGDCES